MVNSEEFVQRLELLFNYYHLSAAAFADNIGVQRSSISHLLSGRNKPSLEFVLKVIHTFPDVNLYWLLNGKGVFPPEEKKDLPPHPISHSPTSKKAFSPSHSSAKEIERVIIFYTDGSFKGYEENNSE